MNELQSTEVMADCKQALSALDSVDTLLFLVIALATFLIGHYLPARMSQ